MSLCLHPLLILPSSSLHFSLPLTPARSRLGAAPLFGSLNSVFTVNAIVNFGSSVQLLLKKSQFMFTLFPPRKASLCTYAQRDMPTSRASSSRGGSVRNRSLSPIRSHRRAPTANDFPVPGDYQPFAVKVRDQGLVSPAASSFSFSDNDPPPIHAFTPPSPTLSVSHAMSTPRNDMEKEFMLQAITRGAPADPIRISTPARTPQEREMTRKKSLYYQEVNAYNESNLTPKDQVYNTSVITVEVKTNVIVRRCHRFVFHPRADP